MRAGLSEVRGLAENMTKVQRFLDASDIKVQTPPNTVEFSNLPFHNPLSLADISE